MLVLPVSNRPPGPFGMPVTIKCTNTQCAATYTVSEAVAGKIVKCKRCGTSFPAQPTQVGDKADTGKPPVTSGGAAATDPFPKLPAEFGRYRVLKLLGRGGMGAVYLAEDRQLGRHVALKLPSFNPADAGKRIERFVREARAAAVLQHPNICMIYDAGEVDGRPFITMALIEGQPLENTVDGGNALPWRKAAALARKVALALAHAHAKGIVHRDLKPGNIMLTPEGEPILMDFGLAKRVGEGDQLDVKLTHDGAVLGTPSYMAPEQVKGEIDKIGPTTDVYALGAVLFELLTGQTPYVGSLGQVMGSILGAPVPSARNLRAEVPVQLDQVCQRALAKEPGDRFPSMAALVEALDAALNARDPAPVETVTKSKPAMPAAVATTRWTVPPPAPPPPRPVPSPEPALPQPAQLAEVDLARPGSTIKRRRSPATRRPMAFWLPFLVGLAVVLMMGGLGLIYLPRLGGVALAPTQATDIEPKSTPATTATTQPMTNGQSSGRPATDGPANVPAPNSKPPAAMPARYVSRPPGMIWSVPAGSGAWHAPVFSPRGDFVAAAEGNSAEGGIRLWPLTNDQQGQSFQKLWHPSFNPPGVAALAIAPHGKVMASAGRDGSIRLWNLETSPPMELARINRLRGEVSGLAFRADGHMLAASVRSPGGPVVVWKIDDPTKPEEISALNLEASHVITSLAFDTDLAGVLIGCRCDRAEGRLLSWGMVRGEPPKGLWSESAFWNDGSGVRSLACSADRQHVGFVFGDKAFILNRSSGATLLTYRGHEPGKALTAFAFTQDGSCCVTAGNDRSIRIWSAAAGTALWHHDSLPHAAAGLALSSDGRLALVSLAAGQGSDAGAVQLWRLPHPGDSSDTTQAGTTQLAGKWSVVSEEFRGGPVSASALAAANKVLEFVGNTLTIHRTSREGQRVRTDGQLQVNAHVTPMTFDLETRNDLGEPWVWRGCLEVRGDTLRLVYVDGPPRLTGTRPTRFATSGEDWNRLLVASRKTDRGTTSASPSTSEPAGTSDAKTLFNGKDLAGWTIMRTRSTDPPTHEPEAVGWHVEAGELLCDASDFIWLRSVQEYGDFELKLEYRLPPNGASGIYFRSPAQGSLTHDGLQVQLIDEQAPRLQGRLPAEGRTGALRGVVGPGTSVFAPAERWNRVVIRCQGPRVSVMINDVQAVDVDVDAVPALRERPRRGYLGLVNFKGEAKGTRFRKIELQPLPPLSERTTTQPTSGKPSNNWQPIFNGRDLAGWAEFGVPGGYVARNGELVIQGVDWDQPRKDGWLMTRKDYRDFQLRLEFQLGQACNSGVGLRCDPAARDHTEINLTDQLDPRISSIVARLKTHRTGALVDFALDTSLAPLSRSAWHTLWIELIGRKLMVRVNGVVTVQTNLDLHVEEARRRTPQRAGVWRSAGPIGLQKCTGTLRVRNIEVKENPPTP